MRTHRDLTIQEIKQAVCNHGTIEQAGPSEHRAEWGGWHTKMKCPACGARYVHETPDALLADGGREARLATAASTS